MVRILLAGLMVCGTAASAAAQTASARTLVVPFDNTRGEPRFQWLSEAAAVLLTDGLRVTQPGTIARSERVRAFEQLYLPISGSLSRATIIKVGQLVGAGDVIVGAFNVEGSSISVTARSIRLDAGRIQPEFAERGELTQLFAIFERLAARIAQRAPRTSEPAAANPPLDAFENYIKGLLAESTASRTGFLEAALRDQPGFDRAKLALWEVRNEQADHAAALADRAERAGIVAAVVRRAVLLGNLAARVEAVRRSTRRVEGAARCPSGAGRDRGRAEQHGRARASPGSDAADGLARVLLHQGDRRRSRSRLHVQPRLRLRVRQELSGRAVLAARGAAPRPGGRRRALRAGRRAPGHGQHGRVHPRTRPVPSALVEISGARSPRGRASNGRTTRPGAPPDASPKDPLPCEPSRPFSRRLNASSASWRHFTSSRAAVSSSGSRTAKRSRSCGEPCTFLRTSPARTS